MATEDPSNEVPEFSALPDGLDSLAAKGFNVRKVTVG